MSDLQACLFFGFPLTKPPWNGQDPRDWLDENDFGDLDVAYTGDSHCEGEIQEFICIKKSLQIVWVGESQQADFGIPDDWRIRLAAFRREITQGPVNGDWILTAVV
jgi:hypothetical protein